MTVRVAPSTIAELESAGTIAAILAEYAAECATEGLPAPAVRVEQYRQLEALGLLSVIAAWLDDQLVGYITVVALVSPKYGVPLAESESFFVAKAPRHSLAGLRLLAAAESLARDLGSPGLVVRTPFGGDLFKLLPRVGYAEVGRTFFKKGAP